MRKGCVRTAFLIFLALASSAWAFGRNKSGDGPAGAPASTAKAALCPVPAAGNKAGADPSPIAIVDGQPIYKADLTGQAAAQMLQIRQQEYKIESQALNDLIRQKVTEAEAKKQGVTVDQLYQKEVDSKVPEPSDAEAKGYYLAVTSQTPLPFSAVEPQIKQAIKKAEIQEAREMYADSLRAKADVAVLLRPPAIELSANDPARVEGNPGAPVTIVEFGDYECPYCSRAEPTLADLLKKYKGEVKLAFHDFPLSAIHPLAEESAEAGRCAEAQGKFWPMHDAMYADQSKLKEADLIQTAARLGVDQKSFAACLKSGEYKAAIQQDLEAGQRAGVTGTPAFFINGRFVNGAVPEAQFEDVISSELAALKQKNLQTSAR